MSDQKSKTSVAVQPKGVNGPFKKPWSSSAKSDVERLLERLDRISRDVESCVEAVLEHLGIEDQDTDDLDLSTDEDGSEEDLESA